MVYPTPTAPPPLHSFSARKFTSSNLAIAGSSVCAIADSSEINGNCTVGTAETYIVGEDMR